MYEIEDILKSSTQNDKEIVTHVMYVWKEGSFSASHI